MSTIYNEVVPATQDIYDHFNGFILSAEKDIFFKMSKKIELFQHVKHIPGDIVECGVFKGTGMMVWLKLLKMYCPHSIKKVIGFDFFDPTFTDGLKSFDKEPMNAVLQRAKNVTNLSMDYLYNKFLECGVEISKFKLVPGDISVSSKKFVDENVGFRISLLYMDLDIDEPTYNALCHFWDRISPGGYIIFDEYGYHVWSESNAVDRFIKEKGLILHTIDCQSPTAFIIKP